MRQVLFTFCALLFVCAVGTAQPGKKKDAPPDDGKEKKQKEITQLGGKSVEGWTHDFESRDPSKREHAMRMVMSFPINQAKTAVGPLLEQLKKHNKPRPIDLSVRVSGCLALGTILGSINVKEASKTDLTHVDEAITLLRSFCKDTQVIVRTRAVQALGQLAGRYYEKVTPTHEEVMRVANDFDTWEARKAGLETLTILALIKASRNPKVPLPSAVWTTYQSRLDDNSMEVRVTALKSLAQFSQPPVALATASTQENTILKHIERIAQKDEELTVRIWATLSFMTLAHRLDVEHLKPIAVMLKHEDVGVRMQAAQALGLIGSQLEGRKRAKEKDMPKIEVKVGMGVGEFIFHALQETLSDEEKSMVIVGMHALAQSDPAYAVGPVVDVIRRKDPRLRAEAAAVLAAIGKHAQPGILGDPKLRQRVFTALQETALKDSDPDIVIVGMSALAHADPMGAIDPVINILQNRKEPVLRAEAAKVLAGISAGRNMEKKSARTPAEKPLIDSLKDRESIVVVNCINALVQMDSEAAIPVLQKMSGDTTQQEVVRDAARQAVKVIQEKNNPTKKTAQPKAKAAAR